MSQDDILKIVVIVIMLLLLAWRTHRGYLKGLVGELATLLSLVAASACLFLFMLLYYSFKTGAWGTTVTALMALVVFGTGFKIANLILAPLKGLRAVSFLNYLDKILGTVVGIAEGILLCYAIQYILILAEKPVIFSVPIFL